MYILFYFWHTEALKKIVLQLLLKFSLSKRDNSHKIEKKVTSFLTIFLDINLSTSNVSGNVVLASLGFSVRISSPKWSFLWFLSLDVTCIMMSYCQQNMPLTWYCKIYFWQFSVMSVACIVPYRFINGIPETGGLLWLKHAAKLHFDDTSSKFRLKHKNCNVLKTAWFILL